MGEIHKETACKTLAALLYYKSNPEKNARPGGFEKLPEEERKPYYSLSDNVFICIDKLGLELIPRRDPEKEAKADDILRDKLEATVRDFFDSIAVWKKNAIPQEELVARLMQAWKSL